MLRTALAGLLLLLPARTLGDSAASSDEVSLLQAEVLTKARAAGRRPEQGLGGVLTGIITSSTTSTIVTITNTTTNIIICLTCIIIIVIVIIIIYYYYY